MTADPATDADQLSGPSPGRWQAGFRSPRVKALVLLRTTLIVSTAYLLVAELGPGSVPWYLVALLAAVLASTALAPLLPLGVLESPAFTAVAILGDTAWITVALVVSGRFTAEFFYLYFFVLFLAGIGENLKMIALGVVVVSGAYVVLLVSTGGAGRVLTPGGLLRIPFLFAVAIFYGYLMDRLRQEQRRAREEAEIVRRLERHQRVLAEANEALAAEIAERRRVEEQLQRANEELQGVAEMRAGLVSTVTHELRNPLTAISNAVGLLATDPGRDGRDGPEGRLVELIRRNTDRMKLLVSDLLDLSKAETGRLRIEVEPVGVAELARQVVAPFSAQAETAGVELLLEEGPEETRVLVDPRRIEQVVGNLLSNAIAACRPGGRVAVEVRPADHAVELAVVDTGVGITADELPRVFEPFYQAGTDRERRRQGTGLGLAISRDLVRAHGSDLLVDSRPGEGSRFWFELPPDSPRGAEVVAFEAQVAGHRQYPYFSLLLVVPSAERGGPRGMDVLLETVRCGLRARLPRRSDILTPQPAHGRLLLTMLSTPRAGGIVVRDRLRRELAADPILDGYGNPVALSLVGPSAYPDDGRFGSQLVAAAVRRTEQEVAR